MGWQIEVENAGTSACFEGLDFTLSPFDDGDVRALHEVFLDPEVSRYLLDGEEVDADWVMEVVTASRAKFTDAAKDQRAGLWKIIVKEENAEEEAEDEAEKDVVAGFVGVHEFFDPPRPQLIFGLAPKFWGRGLATRAGQAALDYVISTLGWPRVEAATDAPNTASMEVLRRLGFKRFEVDAVLAKSGSFGETLFFEYSSGGRASDRSES